MADCLICHCVFEPSLSFGKMPLADAFLHEDQTATEFFFDLAVGVCESCGMVQLCLRVPDEFMFHDEYAYYSSTSNRMKRHFGALADDVRTSALASADPFVVEIGCNDGIMLEAFAKAGIRHLGIDPAGNVLADARRKGLTVQQAFFNESSARDIVTAHGHADAVLAANVICHIADIHSVFAGVRSLLKPTGVFIFEDPYVGAILENNAFDQIYDEHVFYFSVSSVARVAAMHGLEVVDVSPQQVHGGEMRYSLALPGAHPRSPSVDRWLEREGVAGLTAAVTYRRFAERTAEIRDRFSDLIRRLAGEGHRVAGYGATAKSSTIINYCRLGPAHIEYIADVTPGKQGKLTPGAHIPVRPPETFRANYPDYAILFAWNHSQEILHNESGFKAAGGRWVTYVPDVAVDASFTYVV